MTHLKSFLTKESGEKEYKLDDIDEEEDCLACKL